MISYAQNHEDVLLARALSDTATGFYIDVGAYDPTFDSVTRHFYDLGWHGINVEPQPSYAAKLREDRPRDITLEVALSDYRGTATMYDLSVGDGVATIDAAQARRFTDEYEITGETPVQVTTLADVCAQHCDPSVPISFLKVDVEGHERAVLAGADWVRWRPRIVVVEATEPLTTRASHEPWEPLLLDAGYALALFDGLNRWYAGRDEPRLIDLLRVPVNILDYYEPYAWSKRVALLEAQVTLLMTAAAEASADAARQALILSYESLQERFRRLDSELDRERFQRRIEAKQLARLTEELLLLHNSAGA
ncbi:MAG TPA: FkbM family methyltransferase [Candidatus Dormibacteraeota bacterium]